MSAKTPLENEVATLLIETLNLEDISPEEIGPEDELFGDGIGLDSVDALEIALAVSQRYGVQLKAEDDETREAFLSLRTLSGYIETNRTS